MASNFGRILMIMFRILTSILAIVNGTITYMSSSFKMSILLLSSIRSALFSDISRIFILSAGRPWAPTQDKRLPAFVTSSTRYGRRRRSLIVFQNGLLSALMPWNLLASFLRYFFLCFYSRTSIGICAAASGLALAFKTEVTELLSSGSTITWNLTRNSYVFVLSV